MIADLLTDRLPELVEADVCVTGAGAAGSVQGCRTTAFTTAVIDHVGGRLGHA